MEIDLRIADDYCQGDSTTLQPEYEEEYEEELVHKRLRTIKITPRIRLT